MKQSLNHFNWIAPFYDLLARLVFGKSIRIAQLYFLHKIPGEGKVLILGGGTGWLLREVLDKCDSCIVWYIEASSTMLEMAQKKINSGALSRVTFICGTEKEIPAGIKFDVVITNFLFGFIHKRIAKNIIPTIQKVVNKKGLWLVSDFINERKWQSGLLSIMYWFFNKFCGVEPSQLPDWQRELVATKLERCKSKKFYGGFIISEVYKSFSG